MPTLTLNPHFASRVDQRQRERRLVLAGRAHVPRDGKARWWCTRKRRSCTRSTRRLACRDGGPVAPRRVGIALALALRPVLGQVALVVGQVGPVDRDVDAHVGVLGVERGRYAVEARGE